jgi:F-type H+-transporting ATPase subunit b
MKRIEMLALTVAAAFWSGPLAWAAPQEAAEAEHAPPLVPSPHDPALYYQMGWTIAVFLLFFAALSFLVWPKVLAALKAREQKQQSDLEQAELAAKQAQDTLAEYRHQLAKAHEDATRIIDQGRQDAEKLAARLRDEAAAEVTHLRQRAQDAIRNAKEQAIGEIYTQAATFSTQIAGRILQRELNPQDQAQLVEQSLAEYVKTHN